MENTGKPQPLIFSKESRYENGRRFANECLGFELAPSINSYDVVTADGMHLHLDNLNHVMASARMYMQSIGTNLNITVTPEGINIRCQPVGFEGVEINCWGDDVALCDSIVLCCLLVNQEMISRMN